MFFTTWLNEEKKEEKEKRHRAVNIMYVKQATIELIV